MVSKKQSAKNSHNKLSVFNYTDYRLFLREYYLEQKSKRAAFTYLFFAKKAGYNSKGFYKDVVDGRHNLGKRMIDKFIHAFEFSDAEAEYFRNMVSFNDARTDEERKIFFDRMLTSIPSSAKQLDNSKFEYYSRWWYSAIRAFMLFTKVKNDYKSISDAFVPSITPDQTREAISALQQLGMIRQDKEGFYEVCDPLVTSGEIKDIQKVEVVHLINFQKMALQLAFDAFYRHSFDQLSMSTFTFTASKSSFQRIKKEMAEFRHKIAVITKLEKEPDRVFQFNMQLFPLTKNNWKEEK